MDTNISSFELCESMYLLHFMSELYPGRLCGTCIIRNTPVLVAFSFVIIDTVELHCTKISLHRYPSDSCPVTLAKLHKVLKVLSMCVFI
jgi:hypothetical protein